jgi:hypothetical protein
MGTLNAESLLVAGGMTIYTAPLGTTRPADIDAALNAAFVQVGYTTEAGVVFTRTPTVNPINAHQSLEPIRYTMQSIETTLSFSMMQWDADTVPFAFGGGDWASTANGWEFQPAEPGVLDERILVAEAVDGDDKWRYIIPRGMNQGATTSTLSKATTADLAVTFGAMAAGAGVKSWYLQTNSEDVNPTVSA